MIFISFCFRQVFVSKILNAEVVCFRSMIWVVPNVVCVPINTAETKTFKKSYMYSIVHLRSKLKEMLLLSSIGRNHLLYERIDELLFVRNR